MGWVDFSSRITGPQFDSLYGKYFDLLPRALEELAATDPGVMGWFCTEEHAGAEKLEEIETLADEIRSNADLFVLIGVGGSNQGARAVLSALGPQGGPEIAYGGNNLSPAYMKKLLERIEGREVYINVIAKNFATLEPGISFRFLRQALEQQYGEKAGRHIIVTGSRSGDALHDFARQRNYRFVDFPVNIGGRYSAVSAVGLLPMAAGGLDIREIAAGAGDMEAYLKNTTIEHNPAVQYAVTRNALFDAGYTNEILVSFEYELERFQKWWIQLFGESEGKDGKGIFPSACSFSEDLHSLGQYIQQGRRMIMETFLRVDAVQHSLIVEADRGDEDRFGYLDGQDLADINRAACEATFNAHAEAGIPCMTIGVPELSAYYFGQLFYFFEYACAVSGLLSGVNPFDQGGVEAYKNNLFAALHAGNVISR